MYEIQICVSAELYYRTPYGISGLYTSNYKLNHISLWYMPAE